MNPVKCEIAIQASGAKERGFKASSLDTLQWEEKKLRWPGVEPGSTAWKATMLTVTPPTLGW